MHGPDYAPFVSAEHFINLDPADDDSVAQFVDKSRWLLSYIRWQLSKSRCDATEDEGVFSRTMQNAVEICHKGLSAHGRATGSRGHSVQDRAVARP